MKNFRKNILLLILAFMISISSVDADNSSEKKNDTLNFIADEIEFLEEKSYYKLDKESLYKAALNGMHESVDKWTESYSKEEYEKYIDDLNGDFVGLGIYVAKKDDYVLVNDYIEGSPAEYAGLRRGDRIYKADGKSLKNLSLHECIKLLKGKENTTVELEIQKNNHKKREKLKIVRKAFVIKSVKHYQKKGVDIIELKSFGEHAFDELNEVLDNNKFKNGIILDLRNNPGGYLHISKQIADKFLKKGDLICRIDYQKGKYYTDGTKVEEEEQDKIKIDSKYGTPINFSIEMVEESQNEGIKDKLVVLVNENSASASEILTAALKENKRAIIIGDKTYGKGLIQRISPYKDRYIKYTIGQYKSPKGNVINKVGVKPDIYLTLEKELYDINSDFGKMLSYTEFKRGDHDMEIFSIKKRLHYIDSEYRVNNVFDSELEEAVKKIQNEYGLEENGKIDFEFKKALDSKVKSKALENLSDKQLEIAIKEIKKRN